MMTKNRMSQRMGKNQARHDGQAAEVALSGASKWVPVLNPQLPRSSTQDRSVKLWCTGCGATIRVPGRKTVIKWLQTNGLPTCSCGYRYTCDYVDPRKVQNVNIPIRGQTDDGEPTSAARADDPQVVRLNQIKLAREKLSALRDICEPNDPRVLQARMELEKLLESI